MKAKILEGNVLETLKDLPDCSVQCVVTSPPYYGLRDYGMDGQIGLEATPEAQQSVQRTANAASQQASFITDGELPSKARGATKRAP